MTLTAPYVDDGLPLTCAQAVEPSPIDQFAGAWWVVHTKARHEKALASDLDGLGIDCFLPLVKVQRRYSGRLIHLQIPLFPSYLFLCGTDEDRYRALMTHRAANVLRVADQEQLRTELRCIHRITQSNEPVSLYPRLRRGQRCRVTAGSLAGLEGIVLRQRGSCRVYVGVEALGQSAELEIDPSLLEVFE